MSNDLATLIDHVMTLSNELDLRSSFHYTKDSIGFRFMKNNMSISWDFTLIEIDEIENVNNLCDIITDKVYKLLNKIQSK